MSQSKCSYCHMSGHNVRTCKKKAMIDLEKQRQEQYISNHPLSLFPDLMKEKMKIKSFDEHKFKPTYPSEHNYKHPNYICGVSYDLGVFRWNSVDPFQKWVSALTATRTPSIEYGPEHPVLLDKQYPITYWTCLQQETETALKKVGVLMKVARSYEIVTKRLMTSNRGDKFIEEVFRICHSPLTQILRILLEMTHNLEQQRKRISKIICDQMTMTKMITKTNHDVLPLILSYV